MKNAYETYNIIADWFDNARTRELMEREYLHVFVRELPLHASVLDLGCGTGEPIMRFLLAQGWRVTGVDASHAMLAIARPRFPEVTFHECDMRELYLPERFDAIIAWHSFFHLPHDGQRAMFPIFAAHAKPGALLLFTSGPEYGEAWGENGGQQLYHASLGTAEYRQLLEDNGFKVLEHKVNDPDCGGATVWLAKAHVP